MPNDRIKQIKIRNWLKRNSIRQNENYFIKVLNNYDFELDKDYEITANFNGDYNINLKYMDRSYRIEVNDQEMMYVLLEENKALNPKHKNRYREIQSFSGEELIFDVINFIKNKGVNKFIKSN